MCSQPAGQPDSRDRQTCVSLNGLTENRERDVVPTTLLTIGMAVCVCHRKVAAVFMESFALD